MKNPKPRPLFLAVSPYGVFIQVCSVCGGEDFMPIEDGKFFACACCGLKIARWSSEYSAQLECVGDHGVAIH